MANVRIEVEGDLKTYFEKTANAVGKSAEHVEEDYIRPTVQVASSYARDKPVASVFLAIFIALGILPVIIFLGASVFVFALFMVGAFAIAFVASLIIILFFGAILLTTLLGALLLSVFLTASALAAFLAYRFVTLVRTDSEGGLHGAKAWVVETKDSVVERLPSRTYSVLGHRTAENAATAKAQAASPSSDSEESGVVVKTEDAPAETEQVVVPTDAPATTGF